MAKNECGNRKSKHAHDPVQSDTGNGLFQLDQFFSPFRDPFFHGLGSRFLVGEGFRTPRVDLVDNGDSFTIRADMPDMDKKNIKLKITDNVVSITANKESNKETKRENFYSRERSSIGYFRNIAMPEDIKPDTAKAKYENGTLKIDIKKAKPHEHGREISVE